MTTTMTAARMVEWNLIKITHKHDIRFQMCFFILL